MTEETRTENNEAVDGHSGSPAPDWPIIVLGIGVFWVVYTMFRNPDISILAALIQGVFCVATCGIFATIWRWITGRWRLAFGVTFLIILAINLFGDYKTRNEQTTPANANRPLGPNR